VVVERTRDDRKLTEVRDINDVRSLLETFRALLRDAAVSGRCEGFTVTVHAVEGGCDHEL
jgi:hypothetical protein